MTVIMPIWLKERREDGIFAILGSEPPADAKPTFIPIDNIEKIVESEHEVLGLKFAVLMLKHGVSDESINSP